MCTVPSACVWPMRVRSARAGSRRREGAASRRDSTAGSLAGMGRPRHGTRGGKGVLPPPNVATKAPLID